MHTFLHRYEIDDSAPTVRSAFRDVAVRVLLPAVGLWVVVVGVGLLITGPLGDLPREQAVNRWFVSIRTPALNSVTAALSALGSTEFIIGACVLFVAVFWWRTKQWWLAAVPPQAIAVQAIIFMTAALVVGRSRPDVAHLDDSPPTSSYPSGHSGASTAFYVSLAMMSQQIRHPVLRRVVTVLCLLVPLSVGTARLYRGMHHPTDVLMAFVNGLACAFLAWNYLRRDTSGATATKDDSPNREGFGLSVGGSGGI